MIQLEVRKRFDDASCGSLWRLAEAHEGSVKRHFSEHSAVPLLDEIRKREYPLAYADCINKIVANDLLI